VSYELSDRDHAHALLGDIDLDAHLLAIRQALGQHRRAEQQLQAELDRLVEDARSANGAWAQRLVDIRVDLLHGSVYQDAAHSAAAVALLAPLLEAVFTRLFEAIGRQGWPRDAGERRRRADKLADPDARFWDAQAYFPRRGEPTTNVLLGPGQLAEEAGLQAELPADTWKVFDAIMNYRNFTLHNGLEWPPAKRAEFDVMVADKGWPSEWFTRSTSDRRTWIIYLSVDLIQRTLSLVDDVLDAAGRFAARNIEAHGFRFEDAGPADEPPEALVAAPARSDP